LREQILWLTSVSLGSTTYRSLIQDCRLIFLNQLWRSQYERGSTIILGKVSMRKLVLYFDIITDLSIFQFIKKRVLKLIELRRMSSLKTILNQFLKKEFNVSMRWFGKIYWISINAID